MADTPMHSHAVLEKLQSHDVVLDKLQSDVAEIRTDLKDVQSGLKGVQFELKDVQSDLKDVQSDLKGVQSELRDGLRDVRTEMNDRFEKAQRRSDDAFNRLLILIESVQSDVKLMLEHLTRGLTSIARHERRLGTHDGRLDDVETRVKALEPRRRKPS